MEYMLYILLVLTLVGLALSLASKPKNKPMKISAIESIENSKLKINSIKNGSVRVISSGKSTKIRLSGGAEFDGVINGKHLHLKISEDKDCEEFDIQ